MTQPSIETERLILRPPKAADKDTYIDFFLSDRAKYVTKASNRFHAWKTFAMEAGHWFLHGWGPWVVTRKGSDQAIASIGPWHPEGFPERELGWLAFDGAEGQGIAYEAAVVARDHDYTTYGTTTLVSYIDPENARSIRLAERMGAVLDPDAPRADPMDLVYRHFAPGVSK
ncbi:MAG: GNAT family N-acetyltransferase [Pseudomonadota bacterium]